MSPLRICWPCRCGPTGCSSARGLGGTAASSRPARNTRSRRWSGTARCAAAGWPCGGCCAAGPAAGMATTRCRRCHEISGPPSECPSKRGGTAGGLRRQQGRGADEPPEKDGYAAAPVEQVNGLTDFLGRHRQPAAVPGGEALDALEADLIADAVPEQRAPGIDPAPPVQCVASRGGGSSSVSATTRSTTCRSSAGMRGGRVLSRSSPSTTATVLRLGVARGIAVVEILGIRPTDRLRGAEISPAPAARTSLSGTGRHPPRRRHR